MIQTKMAGDRRRGTPGRTGSGSLLVPLDRSSPKPLTRQLYSSIREAILAGRLRPGSRLPPSRALAADLGISRTVVVLVYEHLESEGYLHGKGSAGTFVTDLRIVRPGSRPTVRAAPARGEQQAAGRRLLALARQAGGYSNLCAAATPFRIGEPAVDLFPIRLWARLEARRARASGAALLAYGDPSGHRPLRAAIASYVGAARGVNATAEQVILSRGTQQAIDLLGRVLLSAGDRVWVEDPGYLSARSLIEIAGARPVPVPVDGEGLVVADGIRVAPDARLAYVSPSHQFPLGVTMSLPRRLALLEWASHAGAWIVEDDFDSEFRYEGSPIASLQGLDANERVIYLGTFSKTMFPSLRLGYLIVPPSLVETFRGIQAGFDHFAPSVEQATLADFIEAGYFTRHVRRMRVEYQARQQALLDGVAKELDGLVDATPAGTGMHLVAWLRDRESDVQVSRLAKEAGVEAPPLSLYAMNAALRPGLLLGFAAIRPAEMLPALRRLRQAILTARR